MRPANTTIVTLVSEVARSFIGFFVTLYLARELGAGVLGTFFVVVAMIVWLKIPMNAVGSALTKRVSEETGQGAFLGAGGLAEYGGFEFTNNYSTWDKNSQGPNFDGWVVGNPDANFTDAPAATPNVITADPLQVEGRDTIIGTHDLWYENRGGLAHKDTVSIDGTNYTVYAAEDVWILFKD